MGGWVWQKTDFFFRYEPYTNMENIVKNPELEMPALSAWYMNYGSDSSSMSSMSGGRDSDSCGECFLFKRLANANTNPKH